MALEIIGGVATEVVDLGFIDSPDEVYGVGLDIIVNLATADETPSNDGVYGVEVYSASEATTIKVNLATADESNDDLDVSPVSILFLPGRSYRRIQLDGGGRILFEATVNDEPFERFFELWRNGRPHPLVSLSNPVFSWKSPSGIEGNAVARIIDPFQGRVSVHLFTPSEVGTWKVQMKFVEEVNYDVVSPNGLDQSPPYAPAPGAQEFWRYLPKALSCIVRSEGGWS